LRIQNEIMVEIIINNATNVRFGLSIFNIQIDGVICIRF